MAASDRYDDSKKCPVCNGPQRIPSWWEQQMLLGSVSQARALVSLRIAEVSGPPGTAEKVKRLVEAAELKGAQEARAELACVELEEME